MGRKERAGLILVAMAVVMMSGLTWSMAQAQDATATLPMPPLVLPSATVDTPLIVVTVPPSATSALPIDIVPTAPVGATATPDPALTPGATLAVTPSPAPALGGPELSVLVTAQSDMELLANATLGLTRPLGWSGSTDITNAQLPLLVRLDLELLAGSLLGASTRPPGWFGAVGSSQFAIARDIRHDLELLADTAVSPNVRPPGWVGDDPLMRCPRGTQSLVNLLERGGSFLLVADPNSADFCAQAEYQASQFTEDLLSRGGSVPNNLPSADEEDVSGLPGFTVTARPFEALAFLDRAATQRVGFIPSDIQFLAVARSYTEFSRMALVRGEGFEVYVDYTATSLTPQDFESLPDVNTGVVAAACTAEWCENN